MATPASLVFTPRPQPYRIDLSGVQTLEELQSRLPAIVANTDVMFQTLFEDLKRLSVLVQALVPATTPSGVPIVTPTKTVFGPPGFDGLDGEEGVPGTPGAVGARGPQGSVGTPGLDGEPGDDGLQGVPGVAGAAGSAGATGATGPVGVPGLDGIDGEPEFTLGYDPWGFSPLYSAAYATSGQTIADSTFTALTFDTNDFDRGGIHSTSVNPTRFTVPMGGIYLCLGNVTFNPPTATQVAVVLKKNGTTFINGGGFIADTFTSLAGGAYCATIVQLVSGDYIEFMGFQTTGSNQNTLAGANPTDYNPRGAVIKLA